MSRIRNFQVLLFLCVGLSFCGVEGLFQQQSSDSDSNSTSITSNAGDGSDGSVASYPDGLFTDGTLSIEEGGTVISDSLASALQIEGDISTAGPSVNLDFDSDATDDEISQIQLQIPLDSNVELTLIQNTKFVVLYHVKKASGDLAFGLIPRSKLTVSSDSVKFNAKGFGNYQGALLEVEVTEAVEEEADESIETKDEEEEDENSDPDLDNPGDQTVSSGATLSFTLSAEDDDGDTLEYECSDNCPSGLSVNSSTGAVSWSPAVEDVGTAPDVEFTVSDGNGGEDSVEIDIDVIEDSILTTGLVLHLDAAKADGSTPGVSSGAVCTPSGWTDLSSTGAGAGPFSGVGSCDGSSSGWAGDGTSADPYRFIFNGSSNADFTANAAYDFSGDISISLWVKFDALTTCIPFGKYAGPSPWILKMVNSGLDASLQIDNFSPGSGVGSTDLTTGTWYHVTVVYDSTNVEYRVYYDGALDATTGGVTGTMSTTSYPLKVGGQPALYCDAEIATVALYNKALSSDEVEDNCNANVGRFSGKTCG